MKYTKEEMLEEAKSRGYTITARSGDGTWFNLNHDYMSLSCELWVDTNEFQLNAFHGMLKLTTGKCGSFMNHDHFMKFQRQMQMAMVKLNN